MASTTKIMTAILALENLQANSKEVEITPEMVKVEGTSMGLSPGDILSLKSIVTGMMLCSGNDAANAVAISIAGDKNKFVNLMNEKAYALGMKNTKFSTPSGLDENNHHSTAYDMALLGAYAMENSDFEKIVSQKSTKIKFINPSKTVGYKNHNKLLRLYPYCVGIKTGFTKLAGRCLVSCAFKDGKKLICVTLNAPNDWDDHINFYNYGFEKVICKTFSDKELRSKVQVINGEKESVDVGVLTDFSVCLNKEQENLVSREVIIENSHTAPIEKGQILGKAIYKINDKIIGENNIVSLEQINKIQTKKTSIISNILDFFSKIFKIKKEHKI